MRTFIQYDENGDIIAVAQTDSLPEGIEQPFHLEDKKHGVLEVSDDEKAGRRSGSEISELFKVDTASRKLVEKSARKGAARKAAAKKSRRPRGAK